MNTQSTRFNQTFADLKQADKKALVPFITTGDPQDTDIAELMHALVKGGANIIELGIPFSDPAADGETIQHASERAIANGIGYRDTLNAVAKFREQDDKTPIVLMGYLNPAEVHTEGFSGFANAASKVGADGVILVDLSYESGANHRKMLRQANLDLISLIAPTTSKTRLGKIVKNAGGFVYYVSMRGITGNNKDGLDTTEIDQATQQIREKTDLPVCIGFGIKDGATAKQLAQYADGVVVGSALVKLLHETSQQNGDVLQIATTFMQSLRDAIDN